jgi:hypothetical protein
MSARVAVRKSGSRLYPWQARCSVCRAETLHFTDAGAVAANTRGLGNRTWPLALIAGLMHLRDHHGVTHG